MPNSLQPHDYGILQARTLKRVAFPFFRGSSQWSLNPGLQHCRQILYQLSHNGNSGILEWVAYPFSSRSSWHRKWTRVSIAGGFFTIWVIREDHDVGYRLINHSLTWAVLTRIPSAHESLPLTWQDWLFLCQNSSSKSK